MSKHNVPTKVYITEDEHVRLLYAARVGEQALHARFGANRVWLDESESNAWAFALLTEWRGVPE